MTDRRRKLTNKQKDAIIERQGGVCPGLPHLRIECGRALTRITAVFDHIEQRTFTKSDDVKEFQALCCGDRVSCNAIKTHGLPGAGSAGSDANKRAKVRRARKKRLIENYKVAKKLHGADQADKLYPEMARLLRRRVRIRSRGFGKCHRPMRSRPFRKASK